MTGMEKWGRAGEGGFYLLTLYIYHIPPDPPRNNKNKVTPDHPPVLTKHPETAPSFASIETCSPD